MIDIRKKIDEVEQQSLEMASYPKIDLSATGSGSGIHKDLADVYKRQIIAFPIPFIAKDSL